ncbi:hypothetical protein K438DRAFT_2017820 [Mycena galopus ATCC 62051]|nr:hypothetical protein K438DRAFT_2017820 [Mycena galopus ATCC 62051]
MSEEYTRVDDLWFFDGSLVIKTEKKIFRVSKAHLAARSTGDELIDGIPVVVLHDAAEEVEVFLRAVFDSSYFMPPPEPAYFAEVVAILRLSHKYDVEYLHRRALQHLEVDFYRGSVKEYMTIKSRRLKYSPIKFMMNVHRDDFTLIRVAREVGALWLLPTAYHGVSTRGFEAFLSDLDNGEHYVRTCLAGSYRLERANIKVHLFLLEAEPGPYCEDLNGSCAAAHTEWRSQVLNGSHFGPISSSLYISNYAANFCIPCHEAATENTKEACDTFWNNLSSYFDLPGWPELNAMREVAIGRGSS